MNVHVYMRLHMYVCMYVCMLVCLMSVCACMDTFSCNINFNLFPGKNNNTVH